MLWKGISIEKFKMTLYALIGCLISMINAEYMIHSSNRFLIKLNITGGVIGIGPNLWVGLLHECGLT